MSTQSTILGSGSATGGAPARALPALHTTIVPNTSAHLLEEHQPVRDVLLCSSVAGCPAGALLLCAEVGGTGGDGQGGPSGRIHSCPSTILNSCSQAGAGRIMGLLDSGNAVEPAPGASAAQQQEGAGAAASSCAGQGPSLALYLLHAEPLPVGVMHLVAAEVQALLPVRRGQGPGKMRVRSGARGSGAALQGASDRAFFGGLVPRLRSVVLLGSNNTGVVWTCVMLILHVRLLGARNL